MINLLPPEEKEALRVERNKNLIIVLSYIVIISLICMALVLFSLRLYILEDVNYQKDALVNAEKEYKTSEFFALKENIIKYNKDLSSVNSFYQNSVYLSDMFKTILSVQKPSGLYFTNIDMKRSKESKKVSVIISGKSDNRDNLLVFKKNIESNEKIKNVNFPLNSWIKPIDITFNLTFEILKDEN